MGKRLLYLGAEMTIDMELSLNRFGFYRLRNKIQIGPIRISLWPMAHKHAICFEVNWIR